MERKRLLATRNSITHKAIVYSTEFYVTAGLFENGQPGELFITIAKEGSTMAGMYDSFGIAISMLLQSGWTVRGLAIKFKGTTFEPMGSTANPDITTATSIIDYIFKWLEQKFPDAINTDGNTDNVERETNDS